MKNLTSVRKLDLSDNELEYLPNDLNYFSKMKALQFLTLDSNAILNLDAISGLVDAPSLVYLSLQDNPVEDMLKQAYRYEVARMLPNL